MTDNGGVETRYLELALQMRLATPGVKPTGYQLLLFYP